MASFASVPARGVPPKPPDKGSFPLDHFGECTEAKKAYMSCLKESQGQAEECRQLSAAYLQCRMDTRLMAQEDLDRLGYTKEAMKAMSSPANEPERQGKPQNQETWRARGPFVAGLPSKD